MGCLSCVWRVVVKHAQRAAHEFPTHASPRCHAPPLAILPQAALQRAEIAPRAEVSARSRIQLGAPAARPNAHWPMDVPCCSQVLDDLRSARRPAPPRDQWTVAPLHRPRSICSPASGSRQGQRFPPAVPAGQHRVRAAGRVPSRPGGIWHRHSLCRRDTRRPRRGARPATLTRTVAAAEPRASKATRARVSTFCTSSGRRCTRTGRSVRWTGWAGLSGHALTQRSARRTGSWSGRL